MGGSETLRRVVRLSHRNGLHLTPIQLLVKALSEFAADVNIEFDGKAANAKSTMDLMLLGATFGADLQVEATGADAEAAITALADVLESVDD